MKKRWIAGMTALSVLFLLSGCQKGGAENKDGVQTEGQENQKNRGNEKETEAETEMETEALVESFRAAVLSDTSDHGGRQILEDLERAMEELGIEYLSYDCDGDQTLQDQQMEEALCAGAAIVFADRPEAEDGYGLSRALPEGKNKTVSVVFLDVAEQPWKNYGGEEAEQEDGLKPGENSVILAYREADAGRFLGRMAGAWLLENFETADKNGDGSISYGLYLNRIEDPATLFRAQYSVKEADRILSEAGKAQLVYFDPEDPECFQTGAELRVSDEMELAICSDEETAGNLIGALEQNIPVFTVGDSPEITAWLEEGALTGTVVFDRETLMQAVKLLTVNVREEEELCKGMEDFPMGEERCYYIPFTSAVSE